MLLGFVGISTISLSAIAATCLVTYEILRFVWNILPNLKVNPRLRVLLIMIPIFIAHIIGVWLYAGIYFVVENYTNLGTLTGHNLAIGLSIDQFFDCLYFSATTYTSLGFGGDVIPTHNLRMLAAAEVLNGLVMIGWTISFTYLTMEKFWILPHGTDRSEKN